MFWKKKIGERGYVLYFYLWQMFIPLFVRFNRIKFDVAHAVNFHSDSHPQFLWTLGKPVFWGPIGHHPPVPKAYLKPIYGRKNWMKDRLYNSVKFIMRNFDPFYYISKWTAKKIFVINSGVNASIGASPDKVIVLPAVAHQSGKEQDEETKKTEQFTVLAVGRFVYMKGFDITIRSFALFYHHLTDNQKQNVKLHLVGKGEELERIKQIIREERIEEAVEITAWVAKSEMENIYRKSSVFCFGSHEGAGMVIPEALSYGIPVVCFDNYGPGELCDDSCAIRIAYGKYDESVLDFSKALNLFFRDKNKYAAYAENAKAYAGNRFSWSTKAVKITQAYSMVG